MGVVANTSNIIQNIAAGLGQTGASPVNLLSKTNLNAALKVNKVIHVGDFKSAGLISMYAMTFIGQATGLKMAASSYSTAAVMSSSMMCMGAQAQSDSSSSANN